MSQASGPQDFSTFLFVHDDTIDLASHIQEQCKNLNIVAISEGHVADVCNVLSEHINVPFDYILCSVGSHNISYKTSSNLQDCQRDITQSLHLVGEVFCASVSKKLSFCVPPVKWCYSACQRKVHELLVNNILDFNRSFGSRQAVRFDRKGKNRLGSVAASKFLPDGCTMTPQVVCKCASDVVKHLHGILRGLRSGAVQP